MTFNMVTPSKWLLGSGLQNHKLAECTVVSIVSWVAVNIIDVQTLNDCSGREVL